MSHETNDKAKARRQLRGAGLLQTHTFPPSHSLEETPDGIGVSSLDEILQRARAMAAVYEGKADEETLAKARGEYWDHPIWGRVFIGPMPAVGYEELDRVGNLNRKRDEDLIYLHRGILKPLMEPDKVKELYAISDGPATQELIQAIKRWNPTFEDKTSWVEACVGADRLLLMFLTCAINCNLWPELTMVLDEEEENLSEENQARRLMFESLLRYVPFYSVVLDIARISEELNIPVTMAGAKKALEAKKQLAEKNIQKSVLPPVE